MSLRNFFWWLPFGSVPEIPAHELHDSLRSEPAPHILDVRTSKEWFESHIDGAVNVPISSLRAEISNLEIDRERPVVAICLSAHRSIPAVRLLQAYGYKDVRQLQGGMQAWWRAALPVVEGR